MAFLRGKPREPRRAERVPSVYDLAPAYQGWLLSRTREQMLQELRGALEALRRG